MKPAMSFVVLCGISLLFIQQAPAAETRRKADQPAAQVPKKALQEMAFLIGRWESEGTMGDKKIKGTYEARWAPGRHCLVLKASWNLGDSKLEASGVSGWDPEKKQLVETWFGSGPKGGTLTIWYSIDKEPSAWIGTTLKKFHDGQAVSGTTRLEKMKDAFHGIGEETVNGEEVKVESMTRKVQPAVDAPTAADYLGKQQEYFAGEWNTEIIEGEGAGSKGTWTCRLDPGGKSFLETATTEGKPFLHAIAGYDPRAQAFKEVVFYADGATATLLYRHPGESFQGSLMGKVLNGTMDYVSADGKTEARDIIVAPQDQNRSLLTINKKGNPKAVIVKVVFERKTK